MGANLLNLLPEVIPETIWLAAVDRYEKPTS